MYILYLHQTHSKLDIPHTKAALFIQRKNTKQSSAHTLGN